MSYRYTNTEKWNDAWFSNLTQLQKLLFLYLCDNCDIAGFIEVNYKRWEADLGSKEDTLKGAIKGLQRGLILSNNEECFYIINFLKHQKNLPLNENNPAHKGVLKRFQLYSHKFDFEDVNEFIQRGFKGASKGLQSPIGNGNGIDIYNNTTKVVNWRGDFKVYLKDLKEAYYSLKKDADWIETQERLNPKVNIELSLEKACVNFWATEAGWKHKKKGKADTMDWKRTLANSITQTFNRVYR